MLLFRPLKIFNASFLKEATRLYHKPQVVKVMNSGNEYFYTKYLIFGSIGNGNARTWGDLGATFLRTKTNYSRLHDLINLILCLIASYSYIHIPYIPTLCESIYYLTITSDRQFTKYVKNKPGPGDKLQIGYNGIMRTDQ